MFFLFGQGVWQSVTTYYISHCFVSVKRKQTNSPLSKSTWPHFHVNCQYVLSRDGNQHNNCKVKMNRRSRQSHLQCTCNQVLVQRIHICFQCRLGYSQLDRHRPLRLPPQMIPGASASVRGRLLLVYSTMPLCRC